MRIHDISVSRLHAFISKDPETGRLFIEDNGSKFGTLVQIQAPLILKENHEYNFQAGRSIFSLNLQQEQSFFSIFRGSRQTAANPDKGEVLLSKEGIVQNDGTLLSPQPDPRLQRNRHLEKFDNYLG